ncbi:MAG: c-type cytochrome [Pseudomonadota bacterium]|nr:MAG: cytochrome C [Hydrogenophilales bacterium RIFOXYA1_FULL_63_33]
MKKTSLILALSLAMLLGACGKQESAPEAAAPAAPEAAAPAPAVMEKHDEAANKPEEAANDAGKKVFGAVCALCHASGAAGAPVFGNKADWEPRITQGMDVLYKHALEGYTGAKGAMPARGGNPKLTDDEVKAAVNYMVDKVK